MPDSLCENNSLQERTVDAGVFGDMDSFELTDTEKFALSVKFQFPKFSKGFSASDFESFINENIGMDNVVSLGRLCFPNEWQMQVNNKEIREKLIRIGRTKINMRTCWISPLSQSEVRGYVHWIPNAIDSSFLHETLLPYGEVVFVENQKQPKWKRVDCDSRYFALNLKPGKVVDDIPHFIKVKEYPGLITIKGRNPCCFHCRDIGHRKSECKKFKERLREYSSRKPTGKTRTKPKGRRHRKKQVAALLASSTVPQGAKPKTPTTQTSAKNVKESENIEKADKSCDATNKTEMSNETKIDIVNEVKSIKEEKISDVTKDKNTDGKSGEASNNIKASTETKTNKVKGVKSTKKAKISDKTEDSKISIDKNTDGKSDGASNDIMSSTETKINKVKGVKSTKDAKFCDITEDSKNSSEKNADLQKVLDLISTDEVIKTRLLLLKDLNAVINNHNSDLQNGLENLLQKWFPQDSPVLTGNQNLTSVDANNVTSPVQTNIVTDEKSLSPANSTDIPEKISQGKKKKKKNKSKKNKSGNNKDTL